jgi:hypothetical protein
MPDYTIRDPQSGKTLTVRGDSPPTESELTELFAHVAAAPPGTWADKLGLNEPTPPGTPIRAGLKGAAAGAVDLAQGAASGLASTVLGAADIGNAINKATGGPVVQIDEGKRAALTTAPDTFSGQTGRLLETGAELAVPVGAVAEAIPSTARAGKAFQEVMGAAKSVPVDITAPGNVALRIQELADRGGTMPVAVRKFITRVTDPDKAPMAYEEARDFASNISRLSANEFNRLTPAVAREVADMRVALNASIAKAASTVGKGAQYASAMNEYANAMRFKSAVDSAVAGAKRTLPYATAAGAGYWLTSKLRSMLSD